MTRYALTTPDGRTLAPTYPTMTEANLAAYAVHGLTAWTPVPIAEPAHECELVSECCSAPRLRLETDYCGSCRDHATFVCADESCPHLTLAEGSPDAE